MLDTNTPMWVDIVDQRGRVEAVGVAGAVLHGGYNCQPLPVAPMRQPCLPPPPPHPLPAPATGIRINNKDYFRYGKSIDGGGGGRGGGGQGWPSSNGDVPAGSLLPISPRTPSRPTTTSRSQVCFNPAMILGVGVQGAMHMQTRTVRRA